MIRARPLTPEAYEPFGAVIAAGRVSPVPANMGTAKRFNFLAELENSRPGAKGNLCVFRCAPYAENPIALKLLERHAHSTQAFIPMAGTDRYLVVVARGGNRPDKTKIEAFLATGRQGITYRPGVWHHPIIALDRETDFACLVWEDGSPEDCEVSKLSKTELVRY